MAGLAKALNAIDEEKERKQKEEAIARAVYAKEEADKDNRAAAACFLQSYWRGIIQREEYITLKKAAARHAKKNKRNKTSKT